MVKLCVLGLLAASWLPALTPVVKVVIRGASEASVTSLAAAATSARPVGTTTVIVSTPVELEDGVWRHVAMLEISDGQDAADLYAALESLVLPAGSFVSLHMHPAEGEVEFWEGCRDDPAAQYVEKVY